MNDLALRQSRGFRSDRRTRGHVRHLIQDFKTTAFVNDQDRKGELQTCAKLTAESILHSILTDFNLLLRLRNTTLSS